MALIINDQISTDGGSTSEAYLNIQKIEIVKGSGLSVSLNLYLNEAARQANSDDRVSSRQVYSKVGIATEEVATDLNSESIYTVAYSKIKAKLEEGGLSVSDSL